MQARGLALFGMSVAASISCLAQSSPWSVELRNSVADKNKFNQPASISYTENDSGTSSSAIDVALTLSRVLTSHETLDSSQNAISSRQVDLAVTAEDHRNSQISKEQKTAALSLSLLGAINTTVPKAVGLFPSFTLQRKADDIKGTRSNVIVLKSGFQYHPLAIGIPQPAERIYPFRFVWRPEIGLEDEDATTADATKGTQTGNEVRAYVGVVATLWTPVKPISLGYIAKGWQHLSGGGSEIDAPHRRHYLNPYVDWSLLESASLSASIRFERVSGEDPLMGLPEQKFKRLSFLVQGTL